MKITQTTKSIKGKEIIRAWHLVDVSGENVGRIAPLIAKYLQGKQKTNYVDYLDIGDNVVVINAKKVAISGTKAKNKVYTHYSGYPGGLRTKTFNELLENDPKRIIVNAVSGMLPKNKFRSDRLSRLHVFVDHNHEFKDKFSNK